LWKKVISMKKIKLLLMKIIFDEKSNIHELLYVDKEYLYKLNNNFYNNNKPSFNNDNKNYKNKNYQSNDLSDSSKIFILQ